MSERYKNQLLPYIARKQKLYLCNIRHIFLYPAIFDNLPPYSPRSTVPVSGAQTGTVAPNTVPVSGAQTGTVTPNTVPVSGTQTGTVNSLTADTVPVTVPLCVPATAPYTAPSKGSNEVQ